MTKSHEIGKKMEKTRRIVHLDLQKHEEHAAEMLNRDIDNDSQLKALEIWCQVEPRIREELTFPNGTTLNLVNRLKEGSTDQQRYNGIRYYKSEIATKNEDEGLLLLPKIRVATKLDFPYEERLVECVKSWGFVPVVEEVSSYDTPFPKDTKVVNFVFSRDETTNLEYADASMGVYETIFEVARRIVSEKERFCQSPLELVVHYSRYDGSKVMGFYYLPPELIETKIEKKVV